MSERLAAVIQDRILDLPDADGRYLGESHATVGVRLDPVPCPHADTRQGRPMHRAPWRQVAPHLDAVMRLLTDHSGPTAAHAWRACCRLRWAPLWGTLPVPALASAAHKTALGLERPLSSWLLLHPGAAARPLHELVSVEDVARRLDDEGWLHGRQSVCPAPPSVLTRAWAALEATRAPAPHPADIVAPWISGLWAILGATRGLLRDGAPDTDGAAEVLALLDAGGPGALVREVPVFEPRWALHVWEVPPGPLLALVDACEAAKRLSDLDAAWFAYLRAVAR
jgi:hypothetical protein